MTGDLGHILLILAGAVLLAGGALGIFLIATALSRR